MTSSTRICFAELFLAVLFLGGCTSQTSVEPEIGVKFQHHTIDAEGPVSMWLKSIADLDGDGRVDLVAGGRAEGGLVWYRNPGWEKKVISTDKFSTDGEGVDIDQDGDLDFVAITIDPSGLVWLENPGWKVHSIDSEERVLHDVEVADLDGDGDLDLVARNQGAFGTDGDELHFYRQETPDKWTHHALKIANGEGIRLADIDGDNDADVVVERVWYENIGDPVEKPWPGHEYGPEWTHAFTFIDTGDINGDGRVDIVLAPSERAEGKYRIAWFEAPEDPKTGAWIEHTVEADVETVYHFVGIGDFDNDGTQDIAAAEMEQGEDPDEVKIYFNAGKGKSWRKQVLATTASHSMRIVDVDGDGDLDLYGANWSGPAAVELWENKLR